MYIKSSPFFAANLSHQWLKCYAQFITSDDVLCSHWHYSPPIDDGLRPTTSSESLLSRTSQQFEVESQIRAILRQIMQSVDLDNVTTQDIRKKLKLEPQMSNVVMNDYKEFIDKEMLIILGQLDKPSKITDYLYLGTEWNASNWDELLKNK